MNNTKFTLNALLVIVFFFSLLEVFICLDLAIRIVPVRANYAFGIPAAVIGFAVRAFCLYLVIKDMKADEIH